MANNGCMWGWEQIRDSLKNDGGELKNYKVNRAGNRWLTLDETCIEKEKEREREMEREKREWEKREKERKERKKWGENKERKGQTQRMIWNVKWEFERKNVVLRILSASGSWQKSTVSWFRLLYRNTDTSKYNEMSRWTGWGWKIRYELWMKFEKEMHYESCICT